MITINPTESPYIINNFLNWYCQKIQSQCALTYNLIFKIALTIGLQRKTINFRVKIKIAMQHLSADIRSIWDQSWGNRFRKNRFRLAIHDTKQLHRLSRNKTQHYIWPEWFIETITLIPLSHTRSKFKRI